MTIGSDQIVQLEDAQTKARIAGLEANATSGLRFRDIQASLSRNDVARKIRNQEIAGIIALICIAILTYLVFFVFI
jgi:hypothetical protein